jgi:phosphoribosyl-ATP pyrophosphohydrolase/phosphoribosyl-AMP cyclohydrolase
MKVNFEKGNGLVPVIVQNDISLEVLMLGYMNEEAFNQTLAEGKVTFFSRSKNRLWTKGETSGNYLLLRSVAVDCDQDTLLIKALPQGPVCHTGGDNCFDARTAKGFLYILEQTIAERIEQKSAHSYTYKLFAKGINKIAQKVGEEAVEVVIEAKDNNDDLFLNEAADLMYHYLILLKAKNKKLADVEALLQERHQAKT